jgi:hypothetical protein
MSHKPKIYIPQWVKVVLRVLTLPLMLLMFSIHSIVWLVLCSIQYIKYGGEFALYSIEYNQDTLQSTYERMKKGYEAYIINEYNKTDETEKV